MRRAISRCANNLIGGSGSAATHVQVFGLGQTSQSRFHPQCWEIHTVVDLFSGALRVLGKNFQDLIGVRINLRSNMLVKSLADDNPALDAVASPMQRLDDVLSTALPSGSSHLVYVLSPEVVDGTGYGRSVSASERRGQRFR